MRLVTFLNSTAFNNMFFGEAAQNSKMNTYLQYFSKNTEKKDHKKEYIERTEKK